MSIQVKINNLSDAERNLVAHELEFEKKSKGNYQQGAPITVVPYDVCEVDDEPTVFLPMHWALANIPHAKARGGFARGKMAGFVGTLRPHQHQVYEEAVQTLRREHTVLLALYTGFGKTITALFLAHKIGRLTLFVTNRLVIIRQVEIAARRFFDNIKIQKITTKTTCIDDDTDFAIVNAVNVPKFSRAFFDGVGTLICDECHLISSDKLSECFRFVSPRYSIALSATPYRPDGLDKLLDVYFGHKIHRKLHRVHTVYRIKTGFRPDFERNMQGQTDWNSLLESQTSSEWRNRKIVELAAAHPDRSILILSKRRHQVDELTRMLEEINESVFSSNSVSGFFETDARILCVTVQKGGTGFDHPSLDMLILASDLEEYFIQYLGRCMRTEEVEPIIFDLVDEHPSLARHWQTRRRTYLEHGGKITFQHEF